MPRTLPSASRVLALFVAMTARRKASTALVGVAVLATVALFVAGVAFAAPVVVSGAGPFTYTQGDAPLNIGAGITINGGSSYAGEFLQFAVDTPTLNETLSFISVGSADTAAGVVSIVGGTVFLGNGTTADAVGSIDATDDGGAGRPLRVNFIDPLQGALVNAGFENGFTGWTVMDQVVDLGVTGIASCPTIDTSTYPAAVTNKDNNVPSIDGVRSTTVVTSNLPTEGTHAARIAVGSVVTLQEFDVVHGPAIFSSQFTAEAGDRIGFDWLGIEGFQQSDDYHVFGYLIDSGCTQTEVLDATGAGSSGWAKSVTTIPTTGTYRVVFVNGTFNQSGSFGAGAELLVDNVEIKSATIDDAVAQAIGRKLQYSNSSFVAATTRTVDVTAQSALDGTGLAHIDVDLVIATTAPPTTGPGQLTDHGYLGLVPVRLWDSRSGAKPPAGSVRELAVLGQAGVPLDATAVVLNVTVDRPDGWGYLTVFPCGGLLPLASNVNFRADQTVANAVTVAVGAAGKVCVYTSTATHLVVDVNGAFSPGQGTGLLVAGVAPLRLWDSRDAAKPAAASVRELVVRGVGDAPIDATAVVLNVTVDRPDASGFVTVFPCGGLLPLASNVNFVAGQTVANAVTVAVGVGGRACVYTSTTTHLVVDLSGAFSPGQGTGKLVSGVGPSRLWDSRGSVKPTAGSVRELVVVGQGGVPMDTTAVVLNVTADGADATGFVTVFPCGSSVPLASNVNFVADQTVANAVTVAVGVVGRVCVYTSAATHLIVDINAAFAP